MLVTAVVPPTVAADGWKVEVDILPGAASGGKYGRVSKGHDLKL